MCLYFNSYSYMYLSSRDLKVPWEMVQEGGCYRIRQMIIFCGILYAIFVHLSIIGFTRTRLFPGPPLSPCGCTVVCFLQVDLSLKLASSLFFSACLFPFFGEIYYFFNSSCCFECSKSDTHVCIADLVLDQSTAIFHAQV